MSSKIAVIVGVRPNFMKAAPVLKELSRRGLQLFLIHTGQHYDQLLSKVFFKDLDIPEPDLHLEVKNDTRSGQLSEIIEKLSIILEECDPGLVIVFGDVTSTLGGALAARMSDFSLAHIEAGLRSFDNGMPEEINRRLTDAISDLLFVTEESGVENLNNESCRGRIFLVGNTMIDSLLATAERSCVEYPAPNWDYALATLHRPDNVDNLDILANLITALEEIGEELPVYFSVHPRTEKNLRILYPDLVLQDEIDNSKRGLFYLTPRPYSEFLSLMKSSKMVLTDSGGIQEETTVLGVPCLTLRENTERPITIDIGTNILVGRDSKRIVLEAKKIMNSVEIKGRIPPFWDGNAASRIADHIIEYLSLIHI